MSEPRAATQLRVRNESNEVFWRFIDRRNTNGSSGQFRFRVSTTFRGSLDYFQYTRQIRRMFTFMLNFVRLYIGGNANTRLQVVIHDHYTGRYFSTAMVRNLTSTTIMEHLVSILNSNESFNLKNSEVLINYARPFRGGAHLRRTLSSDDFVKNKRCIIAITSSNNNCFDQCVALGIAQISSPADWSAMKRSQGRQKNREIAAAEIRKTVEIEEGIMIDLTHIQAYEHVFNLSINIIRFEGLKVVYKSKSQDLENMVWFLQVSEHFHYINREHIGALWNQRHFCVKCYRGYHNVTHACILKCKVCKRPECAGVSESINDFKVVCDQCNKRFWDDTCLKTHVEKKMCENSIKCLECSMIYKPERRFKHRCGFIVCKNCCRYVSIECGHQCYHQPQKASASKPCRYFYGFLLFLMNSLGISFTTTNALWIRKDITLLGLLLFTAIVKKFFLFELPQSLWSGCYQITGSPPLMTRVRRLNRRLLS